MRIPGDLRVVVGVDVDEAWRDQLALGVDLLAARGQIGLDGSDLAVSNAHVCTPPGRACTIDDGAIADYEVKASRLHGRDAITVRSVEP